MADKTEELLLPEERKFAEEVVRLRRDHGWTQAQMADVLVEQGITYMNQSTVSRVEKMKRAIRLGEAEAWAAAFNRTAWRMMHPAPVDEMIESASFSLNLLRRAWGDLDAEVQRYAVVRGDLEATIEELREDSKHPDADAGRAAELRDLAGHMDEFTRKEKSLHALLLSYVKGSDSDA